MDVDVILTAILILLGLGVMVLSVQRTRAILPLVLNSRYQWGWQILFVLIIFFALGYLASFVMVVSGVTGIMLTLTGVIFFSGALFVFVVVRIGYLTIGELLKTQKSLTLARDEAIEASRLKSELLARVSHELRTPLHAILGYAEILANGVHGPLTEKQLGTIGRIVANAGELTGQINNLLRQAQIAGGEVVIQKEPMVLTDLVGSLEPGLRSLANEKELAFCFTIDDDVPTVLLADIQRLKEVVTILAENAIKFTERGEVKVRIFQLNSTCFGIEVTDTGIGISESALAEIFEPFHQADGSSTRRFGGTGLGLAIAKQITNLMGGIIYVDSQEGQGSCFTVLLPLQLHKDYLEANNTPAYHVENGAS